MGNFISNLNYVELKNGSIICLENIRDISIYHHYMSGQYDYYTYDVNVNNGGCSTTYSVSKDEYKIIKKAFKTKANSYTKCI